MSMRSSVFSSNGWHVFAHGGRGDPGVYVQGDYFPARPKSDCDCPNLEVNDAEVQGQFQVFIPLEVARAIAEWARETDAAKPGWPPEAQAAWRTLGITTSRWDADAFAEKRPDPFAHLVFTGNDK